MIGYDAKGQVLKTDTATNTAYNRNYTYDGIGNRLTAWQTPPASASPQQHTYTANNVNEITGTTTAYIYNGWNPIAEYSGIDISSQLLNKTYLWGQDINGGVQSAGGVGGLLAVTEASTSHYPLYDGNGNITDYLDSTGTVVAHYQYDAYGNTIVKTGTKADAFSHRFSTKQRDTESGLYYGYRYYGYRYYDPVTGRWPSRDPIEENGGVNLYAFVGNDGVNAWDYLGLAEPGLVWPDRRTKSEKENAARNIAIRERKAEQMRKEQIEKEQASNCAGCAFGDNGKHSHEYTLNRLQNNCKAIDCGNKCDEGWTRFTLTWMKTIEIEYRVFSGKEVPFPMGIGPVSDLKDGKEGDWHVTKGVGSVDQQFGGGDRHKGPAAPAEGDHWPIRGKGGIEVIKIFSRKCFCCCNEYAS